MNGLGCWPVAIWLERKWHPDGIWYMESESDVAFGSYSSKVKVIFRRNRYITWNEGCYYHFSSGISSGMFINPGGPGGPSNHSVSKPRSYSVFYCLWFPRGMLWLCLKLMDAAPSSHKTQLKKIWSKIAHWIWPKFVNAEFGCMFLHSASGPSWTLMWLAIKMD